MANLISSTPIMHFASSPDSITDDTFEDVCSICLEGFNSQDPPTVTHCNHEYHLQCIVEWSQRSKECPICWQLLALKDPASQDLLAAVENERSLRSGIKVHHMYEDPQLDHDSRYTDDSDFEERIMRNFEAAASRVCYVNRRRKQRPSGVGSSQVLPSVPNTDMSIVQQVYTSLEEFHSSGYASSQSDSLTSSSTSTSIDQTPRSVISSASNVISVTVDDEDDAVKPRILSSQSANGSPQRSSSSDILTFPESVKSRFSAASARYKESISKSTKGLKEKLLARNSSVKELSRGVQREMSAGIAGVARMIERLDLASKRAAPLSNVARANSSFSSKGKSIQEDVVVPTLPVNSGETANYTSSQEAPLRL